MMIIIMRIIEIIKQTNKQKKGSCVCRIGVNLHEIIFRWSLFLSLSLSLSLSHSRFLTYSYLVAFNIWLLLCPTTLSHDWQEGSIPLVESLWDPRNAATLLAFASLALLGIQCIFRSKVKDWAEFILGWSTKSWGQRSQGSLCMQK